jgi:hypothetical protein
MYKTCIRILHVTLGKTEGKTSLNKTDSWIQKESKWHVEMDSETMDETFNETDNKRNEKDDLGPVISTENHGS